MKDIVKSILKGRTFLVCMHVDPDGDTIGSATAVAAMLKKLGKDVTIYSRDTLPEIYDFLDLTKECVHELADGREYDAAIALDCADIKRIAGGDKVRKISKLLINIDHHGDNTMFGDINYARSCSSTGELVYCLGKELKVALDAGMASSIYAAIITDTGRFKYGNTTSDVFDIAADLVRHGALPFEIATRIYESKKIGELKLLGIALNRIQTQDEIKTGWIALTQKDMESSGALNDDLNDIVDHLRSLKDIDIAFLLRETGGGKIKMNFRSKTRNVQKIAKAFGGGGHQRAAGAVVEGNLDTITDRVLESIKGLWTEL